MVETRISTRSAVILTATSSCDSLVRWQGESTISLMDLVIQCSVFPIVSDTSGYPSSHVGDVQELVSFSWFSLRLDNMIWTLSLFACRVVLMLLSLESVRDRAVFVRESWVSLAL